MPCVNRPKLNKRLQERQGTQGCKGKDYMMNVGKALNGCGGRNGKSANGPKEDEGTNRSKLRRIGMMGG